MEGEFDVKKGPVLFFAQCDTKNRSFQVRRGAREWE